MLLPCGLRSVLYKQKVVCGGGFGLVTAIVNFGVYRLLKQIKLHRMHLNNTINVRVLFLSLQT